MALRKLIFFLAVIFCFTTPVFADTCTAPKIIEVPGQGAYLVVWNWTETDNTSVSCTASTGLYGYILQVQFIPDTTNPPADLYDVVALDEHGYDWLGGVGADQSSTVTTDGNVRTPLTNDFTYYALFGKRLTVTVSNTGTSGTDAGEIQMLIKRFK